MKSTEPSTLVGVIESVVYHNEDNDYSVIELSTEEGLLVTVVGAVPMPAEGETLKLVGSYIYHKEYGKQFSIESCEKYLPTDEEGIISYLSSGVIRGVGPVTALKIVNRFGKDTFDVMENHPEWLADISGITRKKAVAICESFRQSADYRGIHLFCKDYLENAEIGRIYKALGSFAVEKMKDNPYCLCEEQIGVSFEKADLMAKSLGIPQDDFDRLYYGLCALLSHNSSLNGHTCLPYEKLLEAGVSYLCVAISTLERAIHTLVGEGRLHIHKSADNLYVMTDQVYRAESYIAAKLHTLSQNPDQFSYADIDAFIDKQEIASSIRYAPLQREALRQSLCEGVFVMTGGPGTGKTTIVKAMLRIFESLGMSSVLCAPTGRAAKRMSEQTGEEAKTVHRLLEMGRTPTSEMRFNRNESNPIDERVVILDEGSMMDLFLMEALLRAMPRHCRLILIGDSHQLPSVGAGNVLEDILTSGVIPTVCLTEVFRQSSQSLIVTNAHKILRGEMPELSVVDRDFFFVRQDEELAIPELISDLVCRRLPRAYGSEIQSKLQIITPSKKGQGGIESLNPRLQARLNPKTSTKAEKEHHGVIFREGDRVMQTANDYEILWEKNGIEGQGIFNGDIGVIERINLREKNMIICFDDRRALYDFERLSDLELAYSITVHKSQGSEYEVVLIPMYHCPPMLMTRNLLYTAVTRARKMVILVGRRDVVGRMVDNNREIMRYTTLADRLNMSFSYD